MGQALYRKYRSKSLDEVVGQEHITETLKHAIASGRISHAYLFTGPRGVGKTSVARLLAHELNGAVYTGEDNHLDIIEIDAASSGGVDEVRDLREKVYIAPSSGTYKVYIIDEVHMMTTAAFNALLKTLEEPPAHAIFILATTEAHKLPATIVSRTQRFTFKPIPLDKAVKHLLSIAKKEKIDVSPEALELIAERGEGSFRDSIGMLDQASSTGTKIEREDVERLLGMPPATAVSELITHIANRESPALLSLLARLRSDGYQASALAKQLAQTLRAQLIQADSPIGPDRVLILLQKLIEVPASHNPDQLLELILLEATLSGTGTSAPAAPEPAKPVPRVEGEAKQDPPSQAKSAEPHSKVAADDAREIHAAVVAASSEPSALVIDMIIWQALLESLKKQYNTLYGIIRMARPEFTPGKVTLSFGFAFHQKRANDPKNKKIVTGLLEEITGQKLALDCIFDKSVTPPAPVVATTAADPALGAISHIFGGGEVLKS